MTLLEGSDCDGADLGQKLTNEAIPVQALFQARKRWERRIG
jgi:hypothetical protein